jgi:TrmH family RNA methyltransferase
LTVSRNRALLIGRLKRRKTRRREGAFLAEGLRCASEVLNSGLPVRFAVATPDLEGSQHGATVADRLRQEGVEILRVDPVELAELADTESPQGLLLVAEQPTPSPAELVTSGACRVLVLDGLQDPGNVGTLLRASAAFGIDGVVVLPGTVDPWNAKCVRASAGLVARIPVALASWEELWELLRLHRLPLLVSEAGAEDIAAIAAPTGWALVMGNEGAGAGAEARDAAARAVAIPMEGDVDSLNVGVAGAILLYVLTRS